MLIVLCEANIFDYRFSNTMLKKKSAKMAKKKKTVFLEMPV